jgi:hypothetical protein
MAAENSKRVMVTFVVLVLLIAAFVCGGIYGFKNVPEFRALFAAPGSDVYGNVAVESGETLARRSELTAQISMWIFVFITSLQMIALWVGYAAISNIRHSTDAVTLKIKNLENSEIFFDIPLYFGLFGTVSAFLVMTFSPQSSRLIAYSSTLIGIIFSLLLRLTLQYPLRRTLMRQAYEEEAAATGDSAK